MVDLRSRDPENPFKQQYEREKAKGLTMGALCVVARKLARTCWSLERHGTRYEGARVNRQSATRGMVPRTFEESKTP